MRQTGLLELTWNHQRRVEVIRRNKDKKIAVVFAAVRALVCGNAEQLDRPDARAARFEMKIGNLAFRELVGAYDLL